MVCAVELDQLELHTLFGYEINLTQIYTLSAYTILCLLLHWARHKASRQSRLSASYSIQHIAYSVQHTACSIPQSCRIIHTGDVKTFPVLSFLSLVYVAGGSSLLYASLHLTLYYIKLLLLYYYLLLRVLLYIHILICDTYIESTDSEYKLHVQSTMCTVHPYMYFRLV